MKLRTIKRSTTDRVLYRARIWAPDRFDVAYHPDDWQWEPCEDFYDEDEAHCFNCGELHDMCECHIGAECGRWRNGRLSDSCTKAGSEECDFECPHGR